MRRICALILAVALMIGAAGASAKVVIYTGEAGGDDFTAFAKAASEATGVEIEGLAAPSNYSDFVPKITAMLWSNSDAVDIIWLDELLGVSFASAGYLEPLDPVIDDATKAQFSADVIDNICSRDGVLYMIPSTATPMFLFVNKKLFEDAGIAYPTSEEEFFAAAKALTSGDVYGYGASWSLGGMLFNDAIRWMDAYGGDYMDWTQEGSRAALQAMHDMLYTDKITPVAALGDTYDALNQKFIDGRYAMMYQWPYVYSVIGEDTFAQQYEVIPVPTFATNKTIVSGWQYAVNASSSNKEEAMKVIAWLASEEGQKLHITLHDVATARIDVLNNPEVLAQYPMLGKTGEYAAAGSLTPRPMNDKINAIMDATEATLQNYLTDKISLDECVEKGMADVAAIMAEN